MQKYNFPDSTGALIRTNRILKNLSLSSLAKLSSVSISYLSEIETGKKKADPLIIKRIMASLSINYNDSEELIDFVFSHFDKFYHYNYFYDFIKAKVIYNELKTRESAIISSPCVVIYTLIEYMMQVTKIKSVSQIERCENSIKDYIDNYPQRYKQIYYLYHGISFIGKSKISEANEIFKFSLVLGVSSDVTSMIHYHLGIVNQMMNKSFDSINYSKEAKRQFDNNCNFVRSLFTYVHLGISYLDMSLMDKAEEIFLHCYEVAESINNIEVPPIISVNLSWLYLLTGDYEKVNEYVLKAISLGSKSPGIYIHNAIALMKLGKTEQCKEFMRLARKHNKEMLDLIILNYVEYSLAKNINKVKESLYDIQAYFTTATLTDIQVKKFHLKELINILESNGEYQEACHYYKELLSLKN